MVHAEDVGPERRVRRWRSVAERRQTVQLTMEPGASVAEAVRVHGLNANQVFKWRREFQRGELIESCEALLPVAVAVPSELKSEVADQRRGTSASSPRAIQIELPGRAMISVESGADNSLVRAVLKSLRK